MLIIYYSDTLARHIQQKHTDKQHTMEKCLDSPSFLLTMWTFYIATCCMLESAKASKTAAGMELQVVQPMPSLSIQQESDYESSSSVSDYESSSSVSQHEPCHAVTHPNVDNVGHPPHFDLANRLLDNATAGKPGQKRSSSNFALSDSYCNCKYTLPSICPDIPWWNHSSLIRFHLPLCS